MERWFFPAEYPYKPPSIYMITPNGRFKPNTRLCMSMRFVVTTTNQLTLNTAIFIQRPGIPFGAYHPFSLAYCHLCWKIRRHLEAFKQQMKRRRNLQVNQFNSMHQTLSSARYFQSLTKKLYNTRNDNNS